MEEVSERTCRAELEEKIEEVGASYFCPSPSEKEMTTSVQTPVRVSGAQAYLD